MTLEERIRCILQDKVEELYYRTEGISDNRIEECVTEIMQTIEIEKDGDK